MNRRRPQQNRKTSFNNSELFRILIDFIFWCVQVALFVCHGCKKIRWPKTFLDRELFIRKTPNSEDEICWRCPQKAVSSISNLHYSPKTLKCLYHEINNIEIKQALEEAFLAGSW